MRRWYTRTLRNRSANCIERTTGVGGTGTVGDMGTGDIRTITRCMIGIVVSVEGRGVSAVGEEARVDLTMGVVGALEGEWE